MTPDNSTLRAGEPQLCRGVSSLYCGYIRTAQNEGYDKSETGRGAVRHPARLF